MDIFKIIAVGLISTIASIILKQIKPEISFFITIAGGMVILYLVIGSLTVVFDSFKQLVDQTGINSNLFKSVLKVVGIGYLTEFGANICMDAGNSSIADKIMFAGKITILLMCLPIINSLITIIIELMP